MYESVKQTLMEALRRSWGTDTGFAPVDLGKYKSIREKRLADDEIREKYNNLKRKVDLLMNGQDVALNSNNQYGILPNEYQTIDGEKYLG